MKILYLISKYITLPGTVVKGLWEHITCGMLKLLVEDGRYLQANELCGHVEHEFAKSKAKAFLVNLIPSLINGLLAVFAGGAGFMGLFILEVKPGETLEASVPFIIYVVLFYLGVSFFCNMFPLYENALHNWALIYQDKLTDDQKQMNEQNKEKIKAQKAYDKEAKKLAKANGQKVDSKTDKEDAPVILKETSIATKILLFIPSALMLAGSFLEKYALTFVISVIATVLAIVL